MGLGTPSVGSHDPAFAERYRAIAARDARFDGLFITAVSSTGIYCRPSCPARTPKPENVTFYLTSAAAQEAGYRACRRCLPEAAPGTPEWNLRGDLVGRSMRLVADGVVDREGVGGLASRLGYSSRQVQRLLVAELGAGPLALARAQRAQSARALLTGTDLRLSDVAFAAGFGSVRQFNDTINEVFGTRPRDLRLRGRRAIGDRGGTPVGTAIRLSLTLPVRAPFDAAGIVGFLASRAIAGVEVARLDGPDLVYARTLELPHGPGAVQVTCTPTGTGGWQVDLVLELAALSDVAVAVARVRRLFDLDADPTAVDAALVADRGLATSVSATPGIRVPGAVEPHEIVLRAVVGQRTSIVAARAHLARLASIGDPYRSSIPGLTRLFPTSQQVAAHAPPARNLGPRKRQAVLESARGLADGDLVVDVGQDPVELRRTLEARDGILRATASYVAMRVLGDTDAWLDGDGALLAGATTLGLCSGDSRTRRSRDLTVRALAWSPWRSYAQMHLWGAAAGATGGTREAAG
ncbi:bifunctional transcriptional activator/DNA repair enzyme AdaA [Occultella aeris]|uniref:DNA-3-methyladenine glycosylase 2 n=1 Tax=Occultella aeris TaxID=2761496 RepID=A0A7M4DEI9_9MICO|nr:AlkA N-terminal domain-containing protein [Occultella aeris]VZO35332.1 DNA-3-methyladenine glycosylase 2 [Occultella aeris]